MNFVYAPGSVVTDDSGMLQGFILAEAENIFAVFDASNTRIGTARTHEEAMHLFLVPALAVKAQDRLAVAALYEGDVLRYRMVEYYTETERVWVLFDDDENVEFIRGPRRGSVADLKAEFLAELGYRLELDE